MSNPLRFRHLAREWLVGLLSFALLVAPFGCQFQTDLLNGLGTGGSTSNTRTAGLFVNPDTSDPLLVAGRNAAGDAFFVYGTHTRNGGIGDVQSILVQTADGQKSFITFESGRPVFAQGPDGSYVSIKYSETSTTRLAGTATIHDAQAGTTQTAEVAIDLAKTAQQVADTVRAVTGQTLSVPKTPTAGTSKAADRQASSLLIAISVLPLVVMSQYIIIVMGQMMAEMFAVVAAAVQLVVLAAFTPLFLFCSLLGEVTVHVESIPLFDVFVTLPPPPTITVELG